MMIMPPLKAIVWEMIKPYVVVAVALIVFGFAVWAVENMPW